MTSGEIDGTVEEVGFRSTRIRTFRNSVMYVPNGKIADAVVDNHGLRQYRRFFHHADHHL
ncbi:mechanosensitive ion channel domain-containing protein [Algoriphagus boritolerans]|uniref:mechanosensitive ion channel domain-containing protein n=1 Tax=Algoriphagus boritolerans TaxID=308111 RepID=UPI002FCE46CC